MIIWQSKDNSCSHTHLRVGRRCHVFFSLKSLRVRGKMQIHLAVVRISKSTRWGKLDRLVSLPSQGIWFRHGHAPRFMNRPPPYLQFQPWRCRPCPVNRLNSTDTSRNSTFVWSYLRLHVLGINSLSLSPWPVNSLISCHFTSLHKRAWITPRMTLIWRRKRRRHSHAFPGDIT